MQTYDYLVITQPDGTQVKIGKEFLSSISVSHEQLPQLSQPPKSDKIPDENGSTALTNRQLVILFEALLDLSLSSQFTNIKGLARFISKISGRSEGSVRNYITNGIDYDNAFVRNDVEVVASLLDAIRPDLAEKLRNNIE